MNVYSHKDLYVTLCVGGSKASAGQYLDIAWEGGQYPDIAWEGGFQLFLIHPLIQPFISRLLQ